MKQQSPDGDSERQIARQERSRNRAILSRWGAFYLERKLQKGNGSTPENLVAIDLNSFTWTPALWSKANGKLVRFMAMESNTTPEVVRQWVLQAQSFRIPQGDKIKGLQELVEGIAGRFMGRYHVEMGVQGMAAYLDFPGVLSVISSMKNREPRPEICQALIALMIAKRLPIDKTLDAVAAVALQNDTAVEDFITWLRNGPYPQGLSPSDFAPLMRHNNKLVRETAVRVLGRGGFDEGERPRLLDRDLGVHKEAVVLARKNSKRMV